MNIFQKTFQTFQKNFMGLGSSVASWQWQIPGKWSKRQQLEQFNRYVYTIVSAFALDFAKSEYKMTRKLANTTQKIDHELVRLLENPNPQQSGFQFRELHAVYMKLAGESFWYRVNGGLSKKPKELYLLRPDLVEVEVSKDKVGSVLKYTLSLPDGGKQDFEPDEIIHHKYANPMNPWRGMGVIEASMTYLQTEGYSSEWTKNSIYNSGRPSGILNLKGKMNDEQFNQLKEKFKQEYTGTNNAGKTLLLKGFDGIDWAKLGMDLEGIDLEKVKKITREDIMFMFRTSNTIMGITDDVNRANSREMRGVWMENVIKPELDRLVDQLNFSLTSLYGKQYKLDYVDPNSETVEDRMDEWSAGVDKWLTKNDIIRERNQILGTDVPEKDGGDFIWQPASLIPMEIRKEEKKSNQDVEKSVEKCECGHDHKEPEVKEEVKESKEEQEPVHLSKLERGELMRRDLYTEQERWEIPYKNQVDKGFNKQRTEILKRFNSKAVIKNFEEWLFDAIESSIYWKEVIVPISTEIVVEQSKFMFDFVGDEMTQVDRLEMTPSIVNQINSRVERWASDVDLDTREIISESINEGIRLNETVNQLRDRINSIYDSATTVRSTRIARTETIHLSNLASLEAMQYLPSVVGKQWLANPDACEFCQILNGQILQLGTNFVNLSESVSGEDGGTFTADYEDVLHPPLHPNCRCTILPVNREEMKSHKLEELEIMLYEYQDMDKRTKEARELLEEMVKEKEELSKGKKELDDTLSKIEEIIK